MGLTVLWAPDGAATAVTAKRLSYHPQDLRGPAYVASEPPGFVWWSSKTSASAWSATVAFRAPTTEGSSETAAPFRLAVAVSGRAPNRVAFAPPEAEFGAPARWARVVVKDPLTFAGVPRPPLDRVAMQKDAERLRLWRQHVEARALGGPPETARERFVVPLEKASEMRPDLVMLHVVRGDTLRDLGDLLRDPRYHDEAEKAYDDAVRVGPHFPEARWGRERMRVRRWVRRPGSEPSDYAAALSRIAEDRKGIPEDSPAPAIAEGILRYRMGEFDAARTLLEPFAKTHAFDDEIVETVRLAATARELFGQELGFRKADARKDDLLPHVRLHTSKGPVLLELFENDAPNTVANFVWLATHGDAEGKPAFYDGTRFDEGKPFSLVRGGDPFSRDGAEGLGHGGPGWSIPTEKGRRRAFRGTIAVDDEGPDAGGSRFYLVTGTTVFPDDRNTVFGRVLEGQDVVERLVPGDALERVEIVRLRKGREYRPTTVAGTPAPLPRAVARR
jgi:cyclophilin family peptidyl-prolyl cis-trans isomerase